MAGSSSPGPAQNPTDPGRDREVVLALPVIPGRTEAYRRFVQELQGSRRAAFVAACHRWGIAGMALALAPHRPGDVILAYIVLARDLGDVEARLAVADDPFDRWLKARVRELHGVDLSYGLSRYLVDAVGRWPEPDATN